MTMYRHVLSSALVAACVASTSAHHSHGNYVDTFTDIEGVVTQVHLVNPHSWIYMEVKGPNGQPLRWSLEASSRTALERVGVQPLKPGEPIKVRCHPLRDGSRACLLGFVKTKDGTIKDWDASNVPIPSDL